MAIFTLPIDLYFCKGSLEELKNLKGKRAVMVLGGGSMKRFGFVDRAIAYLKEAGIDGLDSVLEGTTALAYSRTDYVSAAKILSAYADKSKTFEIKAGFVDGSALDASGVKELAELPSKEVLVAKALGGLNAPITGLVTVLNGTIKGLVVALNAIAEQKGA